MSVTNEGETRLATQEEIDSQIDELNRTGQNFEGWEKRMVSHFNKPAEDIPQKDKPHTFVKNS